MVLIFVAKYMRVIKYFLFSFSSIGLAKAALEAINGFNLFGNQVKKKKTVIATTNFDSLFGIMGLINWAIH